MVAVVGLVWWVNVPGEGEATFIDVVAEIAGVAPEPIRVQLSPEDLERVDGVHFLDGSRA